MVERLYGATKARMRAVCFLMTSTPPGRRCTFSFTRARRDRFNQETSQGGIEAGNASAAVMQP